MPFLNPIMFPDIDDEEAVQLGEARDHQEQADEQPEEQLNEQPEEQLNEQPEEHPVEPAVEPHADDNHHQINQAAFEGNSLYASQFATSEVHRTGLPTHSKMNETMQVNQGRSSVIYPNQVCLANESNSHPSLGQPHQTYRFGKQHRPDPTPQLNNYSQQPQFNQGQAFGHRFGEQYRPDPTLQLNNYSQPPQFNQGQAFGHLHQPQPRQRAQVNHLELDPHFESVSSDEDQDGSPDLEQQDDIAANLLTTRTDRYTGLIQSAEDLESYKTILATYNNNNNNNNNNNTKADEAAQSDPLYPKSFGDKVALVQRLVVAMKKVDNIIDSPRSCKVTKVRKISDIAFEIMGFRLVDTIMEVHNGQLGFTKYRIDDVKDWSFKAGLTFTERFQKLEDTLMKSKAAVASLTEADRGRRLVANPAGEVGRKD